MLHLTLLVCAVGAAAGEAAGDATADRFLERLTGACIGELEDAVLEPLADMRAQLRSVEKAEAALLSSNQRLLGGQNTVVQQVAIVQQEATTVLRAGQKQLQAQMEELRESLTRELQKPAEQCPPNWRRHGDHCFRVSSMHTSWLGAHGACVSMDRRAHLASVRASTSVFINSLTESRLWIGLSKNPGGDWGWSDGTPLDLTRWGSGQPDNIGGIEQCALIQAGASRIWHDYPCTHSYSFLCQIDLV